MHAQLNRLEEGSLKRSGSQKALYVYNNFKIITVPLARYGPPPPDSEYGAIAVISPAFYNNYEILQRLRGEEKGNASRRNRVNCALKRVALGPQLVHTFYTLCSLGQGVLGRSNGCLHNVDKNLQSDYVVQVYLGLKIRGNFGNTYEGRKWHFEC